MVVLDLIKRYPISVTFIAMLGLFWWTLAADRKERNERADQTCLLFETDHKADVDQLKDTYRYILQLTPEERASTLNKFILVNLPSQEREARSDAAPNFCDTEDLGRPEPDPVVPDRPEQVQEILDGA